MVIFNPKIKALFAFLLFIVIFGFAASFIMYKYSAYETAQKTAFLNEKISSLETQVQTVESALKQSAASNEANKKQIQEIAKQRSTAAPASVVANTASQDDSITTAVAKVSPAVVSIQQSTGIGSGFIIKSDGYILTNQHVVANEKAQYTVLLSSGDKKIAKVIYRDTDNDIAILKIDGTGYTAAVFGDSSSIKLGQTIATIGNALGEYNNSVSVGIIAGLNRTIEAQDSRGNVEVLQGVIQTDAAINKGNSGGPLLDTSGKVIGINVAMEQGANNISFAIPINKVKTIVNSVLD